MMNREPSPGRLLSGVGQRVNGRRLSPFAVIRSFLPEAIKIGSAEAKVMPDYFWQPIYRLANRDDIFILLVH